MNTAKIHSIDDQGPARRKTPAPILLAALKSDTDSDRDHVTARLEHIRADRLQEQDAIDRDEKQIALLQAQIAKRQAVLARIDSEEAELLKVDAILASKQFGLDRLLVEKR